MNQDAHPQSRAAGRSLADFPRLYPAERKLLEACRSGELAMIEHHTPDRGSYHNRVRAAFVRFLALGGDDNNPVHEHGVQLYGAWITKELDLEASVVSHRLNLWKCRIQRIDLRQASLRTLNLEGSTIESGISADSLRCSGSIFLRRCQSKGAIRAVSAIIGGNLTFREGRFASREGRATLVFDRAEVSGGVFLNDAAVEGEVRFLGARIKGNLECSGARVENPKAKALSCDLVHVGGNINLSDGFDAIGEVRLHAADIEGNLSCSGGKFANQAGNAITCDGATVTGAFFFRILAGLEGGVSLAVMQVGTLCDDLASWRGAEGKLILDGFTYNRMTGGAPTDAKSRIEWLGLQRDDHLSEEFKPQPWEQIAGCLRAMGHADDARTLIIAKHKQMRKAKRFVGGSKVWDGIYGALVDYGYRPWKLVKITFGIWALCSLIYWGAVHPRCLGFAEYLLGPPESEARVACFDAGPVGAGEPCRPPSTNYGEFFTPAYSAEVLLPIISLGYKEEWAPVVSSPDGRPLPAGWALMAVFWFEIMFGWFAGLLLISAMRNLIRRE